MAESRSYLEFSFGLARRGSVPVAEMDESAIRAVQRWFRPLLAWNWHGAGSAAKEGEPYPGIYPGVEINGDHPDAPQPPLREMQAELLFCSTQCLRTWLNVAVDDLERMLRTGEVDGQSTNPGRSGQPPKGYPTESGTAD